MAAHYFGLRLHEIVSWMLPPIVEYLKYCVFDACLHTVPYAYCKEPGKSVRSSLTMTAVRWQQLVSPASAPVSPKLVGLLKATFGRLLTP